MTKLKIWNGNAQGMLPFGEARRRGIASNGYVHAYGCAPSRAALVRMLQQWSGRTRALDSYVRDYWSEGAWGNAMTGIEPTEGLWVAFKYGDKPERVL